MTAPASGSGAPQATQFKQFTVKHDILEEVFAKTQGIIDEPGEANVLLLYGPTGVGKTTLLRKIESVVLDLAVLEMARNRTHIPIIRVVAPAPGDGTFSWKDMLLAILDGLKEPLVEAKIEVPSWDASADEATRAMRRQRVTTSAARRAVESAIKHRGLKILLIDEGHHIGLNVSKGRRISQLEFLKSLADATGLLIVLAGTYQLLDFRDLNGQLNRRTRNVHFRHYDASSPDDVASFRDVISNLADELPIGHADFDRHWKRLYEGSVGCVGSLKIWMVKALQYALDHQARRLLVVHFEKTAWSTAELRTMAEDIVAGEDRLRESQTARKALQVLLGLGDGEKAVLPAPKRRRLPGTRNPVRDATSRG
jgi:GTPase SAR1 family protein